VPVNAAASGWAAGASRHAFCTPGKPELAVRGPLESLRIEINEINGSTGVILDAGKEAKTEILANESLRHSGRTERDNEYDKRTIFDCAPGAGAPGNNGAHDNFDLLWYGLAARVRGLAR
jgi:hypothetical protein